MAESELEIKITWENGKGFTMSSKKDAEDVKTVIDIDENGHLSSMWPHIEACCKEYLTSELNQIGSVMKA